ncbi:MAG: hypothetical protein ACRCS8_04435 [Brevinema sp.]
MGILLVIFLSPVAIFADKGMAPYVLDGSLLIYFPTIGEASTTFRTLLQKTLGIEYESSLVKVQMRIREQMSVNILDPNEAALIGIDPVGPVAYVHLREKVGYTLFRVKNKNLLTQRLSELPNPVYYRILEDKYVIFTATSEILEYQNFKGIGITDEFQRIAKATDFNWDKKFVWATSEYFYEKHATGLNTAFIPQGDSVGGIFEVTDKNMIFNLYTVYRDKITRDFLKQSVKVSSQDAMSFLDYEFGSPAIAGHLHMNLGTFLQGIQQIDLADELTVSKFLRDLEATGLNFQKDLFPYLAGRVSYVVRSFDRVNKKIDATATAQLRNRGAVREFLMAFIREMRARGMKVEQKSLFTQNIYGFKFNDIKLWIGIVENHFIFSTDEESVSQLIQNVYNARRGFLSRQPRAFTDFLSKKRVGGQTRILVSPLLNNIPIYHQGLPFSFVSTLRDILWTYSIDVDGERVGRRDVLILNFN